jgi:hypothetical protein
VRGNISHEWFDGSAWLTASRLTTKISENAFFDRMDKMDGIPGQKQSLIRFDVSFWRLTTGHCLLITGLLLLSAN